MIDFNLKPERKDLRIFSALLVPFFALMSFLAWRKGTIELETVWWIVGVAAAVGVVGLIWPSIIRWVYVVWMAAVFPIGWVMSYILVGVVFYLVVTPIGFIMRLCGRDPMQRQFDPEAKTYWQPREQKPNERYFRQF